MKCRVTVCGLLLILGGVLPSLADDELLATTTEFGITITPTQIYDVIQESQDFWVPVRHYIASERFGESDAATRRQAAELIHKVNNRLQDQMFAGDDKSALDLVDYLATRLRIIELYRRLRSVVGDDELVMLIKASWEHKLHQLSLISPAQRDAQAAQTEADVARIFQQLELSADESRECTELWRTTVQVYARLNATAAGQIMCDFERQVRAADPQLAALVFDVVNAADWAEITRPQGSLLNRSNFEQAWATVKKNRGQRTARLAPLQADRPATASRI